MVVNTIQKEMCHCRRDTGEIVGRHLHIYKSESSQACIMGITSVDTSEKRELD